MEGIVEMALETPQLAALLEEHMGLPLHQMQQAVRSHQDGKYTKIATATQPRLSFYMRDSGSTPKRRAEDGETRGFGFGCCGGR